MDLSALKNLRTFALKRNNNRAEMQLLRKQRSFPHNHPGSVFVGQIGASYDPGCWQHILDMVLHTQEFGYECYFAEIPAEFGGKAPWADIGLIREQAVHMALMSGMEFTCLVDGDCQPEPDLLVKLIEHNLPILGPLTVDYEGTGDPVCFPEVEKNTGLQQVKWFAGTFMLFRTAVFNCPGATDLGGVVSDNHIFMRWARYGHVAYVDTDNELVITRGPGRTPNMTWDERWTWLRKLHDAEYQPADRAAIDPNCPENIDGIYLPFARMGPLDRDYKAEVEEAIEKGRRDGAASPAG